MKPLLARESVLRLAWPLVLSFWMRSLFSFVDTGFAALIGDEAVAAIGLSFPLEFVLIAFWVGTSTGMTSLLSRAIGAHEGERAAQVIRTARRIVLVLIPVFFSIGVAIWFVTPLLVREAPGEPGLEPRTAELFRIYATVLVCGSSLTSFWSILPDSIVKAHHDTRATMWAGILSNLLNVTLNAVFVLVFGWGIFGIALSTVLGRLAGLVYAMRRAAAHERTRLEAGRDTVPGIDARPYRAILVLAVPAALTYALMATESAIVNALLARFPDATAAIAAFAIQSRWAMFFLMPIIATGVALLPFTGRLWGRRDLAGIRRAMGEVSAVAGAYVLLLVTPLCLVFRGALTRPFAEAPLTQELAAFGVALVPLACVAALPFFAARPVFEGMQRGWPGLAIAILRHAILTPVLAVAFGLAAREAGFRAYHGVIVALVAATAAASLVLVAWLRRTLRAADSQG